MADGGHGFEGRIAVVHRTRGVSEVAGGGEGTDRGWHQMIGEPTIADAILDRIIHNAHRIELKGDSMRRKSTKPGLTQTENPEIISQDE
jgi:hypothetical protein